MSASITIRVLSGSAWTFRRVRTRFGTYLTPNFAFTWQLAVLLFLAGLVVDVWETVSFVSDGKVPGFYVMQIVVWTGFGLAALLACWAMMVSRCAELAALEREGVAFWYRPWCVHLVFVAYPLLGLSQQVVLGALLSDMYGRVHAADNRLLEGLAAAQATAATLDARRVLGRVAQPPAPHDRHHAAAPRRVRPVLQDVQGRVRVLLRA